MPGTDIKRESPFLRAVYQERISIKERCGQNEEAVSECRFHVPFGILPLPWGRRSSVVRCAENHYSATPSQNREGGCGADAGGRPFRHYLLPIPSWSRGKQRGLVRRTAMYGGAHGDGRAVLVHAGVFFGEVGRVVRESHLHLSSGLGRVVKPFVAEHLIRFVAPCP